MRPIVLKNEILLACLNDGAITYSAFRLGLNKYALCQYSLVGIKIYRYDTLESFQDDFIKRLKVICKNNTLTELTPSGLTIAKIVYKRQNG